METSDVFSERVKFPVSKKTNAHIFDYKNTYDLSLSLTHTNTYKSTTTHTHTLTKLDAGDFTRLYQLSSHGRPRA